VLMPWSSITSDDVPPCIQSRLFTQPNHFT
jgi:hypothetical protein